MSYSGKQLHAQTVQIHDGSDAAAALRTFIEGVDDGINDPRFAESRRGVETLQGGRMVRSGTSWGEVYTGIAIQPVQSNFRVATFDLETFASLVPSDLDPRANDGAGPPTLPHKRIHAPAQYMFRRELGIRAYLDKLLSGELSELRKLALAVAQEHTDHHAVGALDYYQDRNADNHAFHKDTTGTTLFVALHYLNPVELLGAEFIYDRTSSGEPLVSRVQRKQTSSKSIFKAWPQELQEAMQTARALLPQESVPHVHCETIPPYGIITFVDELIYHATPLAGSRPKDWSRLDYLRVELGSDKFAMSEVPVEAENARVLKRTISTKKLTAPNRGPDNKRRFARLWICIQPRSWTKVACRDYSHDFVQKHGEGISRW